MIGITHNKKFFIKQNTTLPVIKYPLTDRILEMYDISDDMLKSVAITFSMYNVETGTFHIANEAGNLIILEDRPTYPDEEKYTLTYRLKEHQTSKTGNYVGEFVVDFIGYDSCGKIKFPLNNGIDIIISNSTTKTTVI